MSKIETYQDGTLMGTFSQIKLDDGSKILISLTQTEIAVFKVGFLGAPKDILWKEDLTKFLGILSTADSSLTDNSPLELAVRASITCKNIDEVKAKFEGLKRLEDINNQMNGSHQKKEELLDARGRLADKEKDLVNKIGGLMGDMSEKVTELESWRIKLKSITESLVIFLDHKFDAKKGLVYEFINSDSLSTNTDQEKELLSLSFVEIVWSIYSVFSESEAKDIIEELKSSVLQKYFPDTAEKEKLDKLFRERWDEYAQVLDSRNKNLILQVGGIFCDHFFGTRISKVEIMGLIGMSFIASAKEAKQLLEKFNP